MTKRPQHPQRPQNTMDTARQPGNEQDAPLVPSSDLGQLFVLEGPDGVGKSELGRQLVAILGRTRTDVLHTAFPGNDAGTLGNLVYEVHHDAARFGLNQLSPAGLQLLHLAAHVDSIETRILPALRRGTTVVLDRFWWSMEAYGTAGGVREQLIGDMVDLERGAWEGVTPTAAILVDRDEPLRSEPMGKWMSVRGAYQRIAGRESALYHVVFLDNRGQIEETTDTLQSALSRFGV